MKLTVIGIPQPQGSKSGFPVRRANGTIGVALREGGSKQAHQRFSDWRRSVRHEAQCWWEAHGKPAPADGAVTLSIEFFLPRPKSLPKRVAQPIRKPDLSKLVRCVEDALTGILYADDARIVHLCVTKSFALDSTPRAEIEVESLSR